MRRRTFLQLVASAAVLREGPAVASAVTGAGLGASNSRSVPNMPFAVNGQISNGQSLSTGYAGGSPLSTTQPYSNIYLFDSSTTYDITNPNAGTLSLVPLVGGEHANGAMASDFQYPYQGIVGESPDVACANGRVRLALAGGYPKPVISSSVTGNPGRQISYWNKGGVNNAYNAGLFEVRATKRLLGSQTYGITWILIRGGESDSFFAIAGWMASLATLLANYQTDVAAITGQTQAIRMMAPQQNSSGVVAHRVPQTNITAQDMFVNLQAHSGVFVSGATYPYRPSGAGDPHLINLGYRNDGEKQAQACYSVDTTGAWLPLYPTAFVRNNGAANGVGTTSVTGTFHVPVGNLVYDGTLAAPHQSGILATPWGNAKGFEAIDNTPILCAAISGVGVSPIAITTDRSISANSNIVTGSIIAVGGNVGGNAAVNDVFVCTVVDDTHITLNGSTGSGNSTGGGKLLQILLITSATIVGPNQVTITIGATTAKTQLTIGYADTPDIAGQIQGVAAGGRSGLLRDQDPYAGASGDANYNWCLEFYMAIA